MNNKFLEIENICLYNSNKVLEAFRKNKVSEVHFNTTTGYGYNDIGRDTIEKVYADIFKAEDALVRSNIISGTHAITLSLFGILRPGNIMLSITGRPYDTLDEVIGLRENASSLISYGVKYADIDLIDNDFDYNGIKNYLLNNKVKVVYVQRSTGYANRSAISISKLENLIKYVRKIDSDVIIMVDNCYCEFVTKKEPIEVGADIAIGSLIKNLGASIVTNGGYIVGKSKYISLIAERLTVPGQGKETGPSLGQNRYLLQGLALAPSVVAASLKVAVLTSKLMEEKGYLVEPKFNDERVDIVQKIIFNDRDKMVKYCKLIQKYSLIDSFAIPEETDMPGYSDKIIMASGSFTMGSSIELSCDGPIRPPYIAYQQGSITYEYGKIAIENIVNELNK